MENQDDLFLPNQLMFDIKSSQAYSQARAFCRALYGGGFPTTHITVVSTPAVSTPISKCLQKEPVSKELKNPDVLGQTLAKHCLFSMKCCENIHF